MQLKQKMYARKDKTHNGEIFFNHISSSEFQTGLYPKSRHFDGMFEVCVSIHEDQTPETKCRDFELDYWGWVRTGKNEFSLVQPSYPQFTMQFAGGGKGEEKVGQGKMYRLSVKEIRKL